MECRGQVTLKNELVKGEPFCFCSGAQFSTPNIMSRGGIDSCVVAENILERKSGVECLYLPPGSLSALLCVGG